MDYYLGRNKRILLSQLTVLGIYLRAAGLTFPHITFEPLSDFCFGNYLSHWVTWMTQQIRCLFPTMEAKEMTFSLPNLGPPGSRNRTETQGVRCSFRGESGIKERYCHGRRWWQRSGHIVLVEPSWESCVPRPPPPPRPRVLWLLFILIQTQGSQQFCKLLIAC